MQVVWSKTVSRWGESILLCRRNVPVAEIRPVLRKRREVALPGKWKEIEVPAEFFEPLPEDLLDSFSGGASEA